MTNKKPDDDAVDDKNPEKKLYKSRSHNINDNSKNTNLGLEQVHKTPSGSNVFSRLMHSEPHVQY
jgi:hypothetical protein